MVKLSIIIPAYNAEPYIHELLDGLEKQVTKEVQVIVIDDGSSKPLELDKPWIEFYSNDRNRGAAYTRNRGLELAKGRFIHFVDADDLLAENYVKYVLKRLDEDFDYMDLSWKSLKGGGARFDYKLNSDSDYLDVPGVALRVFNRDFIGNHRFNEMKDAAEDADFTRHLDLKRGKRICATEYMYFYRTYTPNSNVKQFINGETKTHRIAYYYNHLTPDMTAEIEQIKRDDQRHEVLLITNRCDVPGIEQYCKLICPPSSTEAMESKGEPNNYVRILPMTTRADIVVWISKTFPIGGIESFIYSFCEVMRDKYEIVVLYDIMDQIQINRVSKYARCVKNNVSKPVICDTVIVVRIFDKIPPNVRYKKSIQMAHCCKQSTWTLPQDKDAIVCVSSASKESFGEDGKDAVVINNPIYKFSDGEALLLISSTRIGAGDKGKNDERMLKLARLMNAKGVKYIWMYFGNRPLHGAPQEMVYMGQTLDVAPYIRKADYLVQLSDTEAYSYALLEALCLNTPVIVTPLGQNKDMHIKDGENAYIVPFDFNDSFDVTKFRNIPKFTYKYDNTKIVKKWVKLIENIKPKGIDGVPVYVKALITYHDLRLNRLVNAGETLRMEPKRADELAGKGFVEKLKE